MSDTTLNRFLAQGTNAERLAFTPSPPTPASGPDPGYLFYETDTGDMYAWDDVGSAWVQVTSAGSFTNPMTTAEDLIVGGVAGAPGRLGVGSVGQVLTVGSGGLVDWATPASVGGAITTSGYTMTSARVLGRTTASTGAIEELTVSGTGSVAFTNSPVFVTPALGTPASGVATNLTGLPVSTGISGLGTGVATALAVNVGSAGAPVVFNGALGTPSSGTLTNATGLVLTSGVTGILPVANGGTATATPALVAGTNITITGTWPNQTINSSAGGSGTVNSGTATNFAYYPATAAAVSGTGTLAVSATGRLTMTPTALASGLGAYFTLQAPSDQGMTTGNESIGTNFLAAATNRQWAGSTGFATQREFNFGIPTYAFASATGTIADGYTVYIGGAPIAGTNAAITQKWALGVASGNTLLGGDVIWSATLKTSGIFNPSNLGLLDLRSQGGLNISPSTSSAGILSIAGSAQDVVLSDDTSFRSWQGPSVGTSGRGLYLQRAANQASLFLLSLAADSVLNGATADGSYGSVTATATARRLRIYLSTFGGTTWATPASIFFTTTQAQTESARGTQITIATTPNGSTTAALALTLDQDQTATFGSSVKTSAPSGGTAAFWKFGTVATVTPTLPNRTIELDVGGTRYFLTAKTTND